MESVRSIVLKPFSLVWSYFDVYLERLQASLSSSSLSSPCLNLRLALWPFSSRFIEDPPIGYEQAHLMGQTNLEAPAARVDQRLMWSYSSGPRPFPFF